MIYALRSNMPYSAMLVAGKMIQHIHTPRAKKRSQHFASYAHYPDSSYLIDSPTMAMDRLLNIFMPIGLAVNDRDKLWKTQFTVLTDLESNLLHEETLTLDTFDRVFYEGAFTEFKEDLVDVKYTRPSLRNKLRHVLVNKVHPYIISNIILGRYLDQLHDKNMIVLDCDGFISSKVKEVGGKVLIITDPKDMVFTNDPPSDILLESKDDAERMDELYVKLRKYFNYE